MTASKAEGKPAEIDLIPYDAPLSFPDPTLAWRTSKAGAANNRRDQLTEEDHVPGCDLTGRWVIVSGSNTGVGREAALLFAKWGANLILACRPNAPRTETTPEQTVRDCLLEGSRVGRAKGEQVIEWWEFDAADLSSVEAFAERWLATRRPLDILCNNAGIGSSPGGHEVFKTKDGFEIIHQVNFLAHVLLTLRLLPSLAAAKAPRVVCTTSCYHFYGRYDISNFNGGPDLSGDEGVNYYQNNKLYFQIWLTELQHRLSQHDQYEHITINGVHPGYINSGVWNLNRSATSWVAWFRQLAVKTVAWRWALDSRQGGFTVAYVATADECGPPPGVVAEVEHGRGGGRYFNRIWEEEPMPHCKDRDARSRVWRKVGEELELKEKGLLDVLGFYSEGQ